MQQKGINPNKFTFLPILRACASLRAFEQGKRIHELITANGCESDNFVGSCLVDMYAKCGSIIDAQRLFRKMPVRNVFSCSAMIHGYVKCGEGQKVLELFQQMKREGVQPDSVIFVGLLNACSSLAQLEEGRRLYEEVIQRGVESNLYFGKSLIDMYAKCGNIENARIVFNAMHRCRLVSWSAMIVGYVECGYRGFENMPRRSVVSWNALLGGYALHGQANEAPQLFERMSQEGTQMDGVTFVSLLSACDHGRFVDEGVHYLNP